VVTVGDAAGLETVVLLNPVAGDHAYELPPLAFKVVLVLKQIAAGPPAFAIMDD
jgi:hypothetical protein